MYNVKHFSLASLHDEDAAGFLRRLGGQIESEESLDRIIDITLQQPDEKMNERQFTGTVYYVENTPSPHNFEMQLYSEYVVADNGREAVLKCSLLINQWLSQNDSVEVYDIKYTFGVDNQGGDIVKLNIFYDDKISS